MGLAWAPGVKATTITQEMSYGPMDTPVQTNWGQDLTFSQAQAFLGGNPNQPLLSVSIVFKSQVSGSTKIENYNNSSASTYQTSNTGNVTVKLASNNDQLYGSGNTTFSHTSNLTKYDGMLDFSGTSGVSYSDVGALKSQNTALMSGDADFAAFLGSGTVTLTANGNGMSAWSATSGNFVPIIKTLAWVDVTITYTYLPLPSAAWGGILLIGLLAVMRIRKVIRRARSSS